MKNNVVRLASTIGRPVQIPKRCSRKTESQLATDKIIGEQLRIERLSRRLSQERLAKAIGVTFQAWQRYEKGEIALKVYQFIKIAEILDLDTAAFINDLIDGDAMMRSPEDAAASHARAEVYALLSTPNALEMMRLFSQMPAKSRNAILEVARGVVDRTDGKA